MFDVIRAVAFDEGGSTAIEYGLCAVLISLAAIATYTELGSMLDGFFRYVNDGLVIAAGS